MPQEPGPYPREKPTIYGSCGVRNTGKVHSLHFDNITSMLSWERRLFHYCLEYCRNLIAWNFNIKMKPTLNDKIFADWERHKKLSFVISMA